LHEMVSQQCSSRLSVRTCYRDDLRIRVFESKFNLIYNGDIARGHLLHDRFFLRYTRAFNDQAGSQYLVLGMTSFFKWNAGRNEVTLILLLDLTSVGNKDVIPLSLRKEGCTCATFAGAEYDDHFFHCSFNVANVRIARSIPTIQNLVTIF